MPPLFDSWTEKYDSWFNTPTGLFVKRYEAALLLDFLAPSSGEKILDVGCGTGLFTQDVIRCGAIVTGMDLSLPMLHKAIQRTEHNVFTGVCGEMSALPFANSSFDKTFSMTAIEFVEDAYKAITELERVTRRGGLIVLTTLNRLSPWAEQRKEKAEKGHTLFQNIFFRSPDDMRQMVPEDCSIRTAIHFQKNDPVDQIPDIEREGTEKQLDTGAFLAVRWHKA